MAKAVLLVLLAPLAGASILPCWCQQGPVTKQAVSDLLTKLQSKEWTERSDAVNEIRLDSALLHSRNIQTALTDLLDREYRELDKASRSAQTENRQDASGSNGQEDGAGEGYAEYISWLAETVGSFADWNDPRQVRLLVNAATVEYPSSPTAAAARARAAMPFILKRARDGDPINRAIAIPMLAEALSKGRGSLELKTVRNAEQIVVDDLRDSDAGIRGATVAALGSFGGRDAIPMLQEIARSDPASEKTDDGGQWFPLRKLAADSIAAIQNREAQSGR